MVQFKKIMKFNYLFFFIFISINTYSIENYEAEYRFKSSEINLKGKRVLTINEDGISSLSFKAKSTLARLYFETNFNIDADTVSTKSYVINVKPGFVNRDQEVLIDKELGLMSSLGRDEWSVKSPQYEVLDPLNAQVQIRINILKGLKSFNLNLLEIKNGEVEDNLYTVTSEDKKCLVGEDEYSCIELTRIREDEDRKTTYLMAKELNYMFVKIKDVSPKRTNTLTLEKILSLG